MKNLMTMAVAINIEFDSAIKMLNTLECSGFCLFVCVVVLWPSQQRGHVEPVS